MTTAKTKTKKRRTAPTIDNIVEDARNDWTQGQEQPGGLGQYAKSARSFGVRGGEMDRAYDAAILLTELVTRRRRQLDAEQNAAELMLDYWLSKQAESDRNAVVLDARAGLPSREDMPILEKVAEAEAWLAHIERTRQALTAAIEYEREVLVRHYTDPSVPDLLAQRWKEIQAEAAVIDEDRPYREVVASQGVANEAIPVLAACYAAHLKAQGYLDATTQDMQKLRALLREQPAEMPRVQPIIKHRLSGRPEDIARREREAAQKAAEREWARRTARENAIRRVGPERGLEDGELEASTDASVKASSK